MLVLRSGRFTDLHRIADIPKGACGEPESLRAISGCFGWRMSDDSLLSVQKSEFIAIQGRERDP